MASLRFAGRTMKFVQILCSFSGFFLSCLAINSFFLSQFRSPIAMAEATQTLIFTYGTLKQGHGNHFLMQDLIRQKDASFLGAHVTHQPHPLVIGPHGIPYLINLLGYGHRVKGELYSVSTQGLVRLDELEGISIGHYERLPIQVYEEEKADVLVAAEAYFAHRSFGERLWERNGKVGLDEFGEKEGKKYIRKEDRPDGSGGILHDITSFIFVDE